MWSALPPTSDIAAETSQVRKTLPISDLCRLIYPRVDLMAKQGEIDRLG
jgi:hypothetical protein